MIQRIQTIFLLLFVIFQAIFLSFPIMHFVIENNEVVNFYAKGIKSINDEIIFQTLPLFLLSIIILALGVISIFLYKKRVIQIRICIYNILLNLGLIGLTIFTASDFVKNTPIINQSYGVATVLPVVNIILLYLAFRGIRKDELLVKAYDRLR